MKRIVIAAAVSLCAVFLAAPAFADTLIMRDGTRLEGNIVSIKGRTITFEHTDGTSRRYFTSQVEGIAFVSAERANPRATNGRWLEAPAGMQIVVRTTEAIDSDNAGVNQVFTAIVDEPAVDRSGHVVIPRGASVQVVIRQLTSSVATGSPELALDIQSITIEGRRYAVRTDSVSLQSGTGLGTNTRNGAGDEIARTRGRHVKVPAATVITFRWDTQVTLQAAR